MKKQIFKMKILRNSLIFCLMLFFSHVSIASSQVVKVSVNLLTSSTCHPKIIFK